MKQVMIYNYVLSGIEKAICDDEYELLRLSACHVCKRGAQYSIINTGDEYLLSLTIVVER